MKTQGQINIKTPQEIEALRKSGKILASISKQVKRSLKTGISTKEIDSEAEKLILQNNVRSAFKGYRGYPACVCASINHEVVHGIPSNRVLKDGDIVSIDIGIISGGFFADMAFTAGIGRLTSDVQKLLDVTEKALYKGVEQAVAKNQLYDISYAIQSFVESHDFSVVRDFVGHGIGTSLHEEPEIPNFGKPHTGPVLEEGMVLAIEPMANMGLWQTEILDDGWTVVTKDRKPSAHFEHTVAITKKGPEVLTA